jgi:hypothetical protein
MLMVKIHLPKAAERAEALVALMRRGRVMCLRGDIFVVPEPALVHLRTMGVKFLELGRGGKA